VLGFVPNDVTKHIHSRKQSSAEQARNHKKQSRPYCKQINCFWSVWVSYQNQKLNRFFLSHPRLNFIKVNPQLFTNPADSGLRYWPIKSLVIFARVKTKTNPMVTKVHRTDSNTMWQRHMHEGVAHDDNINRLLRHNTKHEYRHKIHR